MGSRFEIIIELQPDGHYMGFVVQVPAIQMTGQSAQDLEIEIREALEEVLRLGSKPPDEWECVVVSSPNRPKSPKSGGSSVLSDLE